MNNNSKNNKNEGANNETRYNSSVNKVQQSLKNHGGLKIAKIVVLENKIPSRSKGFHSHQSYPVQTKMQKYPSFALLYRVRRSREF